MNIENYKYFDSNDSEIDVVSANEKDGRDRLQDTLSEYWTITRE